MKKQFYSHLISYESLFIELDTLDLTQEEKEELLTIVQKSMHHSILDLVMSHLHDNDKNIFLDHLHNNDHNSIWQLLREKISFAEEKIKRVAEELKKDLQDDLTKVRT